ncbi:hypothetical protein SO802_021452 [Lithocarpus litseifolius]|uniref:SHSP domain-containing protein n=1 Tax=Lithocarpus litseifolius TaxID=425828 RepID=A0AAW2CEY8_9ROSI
MEETKSGAHVKRVYEDFEPYCKWYIDEECNILDVHLQDFQKEQLKAQLANIGVLRILGERPLDETRWSRFQKEIKVAKNCITSDIHAKFGNGVLSVTMPKKVPSVAQQEQQLPQAKESQEIGKPKAEVKEKENKLAEKPTVYEREGTGLKAPENAPLDGTSNKFISISKLNLGNNLAVKVLAVAVVVALVAYVTYKYI